MKKSEILKLIKEEIKNGLPESVEELSIKLKVPEEECLEILNELGIDILKLFNIY